MNPNAPTGPTTTEEGQEPKKGRDAMELPEGAENADSMRQLAYAEIKKDIESWTPEQLISLLQTLK